MAQEAAHSKDQSMEEILQSIKRIIAEENADETVAPASPPKPAAQPVAPKPVAAAPVAAGGGEDVLELTELVDPAEPAVPVAAMPELGSEPEPESVMTASEEMFSFAPTRTESLLEAFDKPEEHDAPAPTKDVLQNIDSLLSSEAAAASSRALRSLAAPPSATPASKPVAQSMPFRSGNTVEDLALEALRPMLKEWLDTNLPRIVETLVEREIKKIAAR